MTESICTIPINDIFADKTGCPICRMYSAVEKTHVDFIVGGAVMTPEIRVQTNKTGFCRRHLGQMQQAAGPLPNTLLLSTHLEYIREELLPANGKPKRAQLDSLDKTLSACFVCDRIEANVSHMLSSLFAHWANEEEFRAVYAAQEYVCLDHYAKLCRLAESSRSLNSKQKSEFCGVTSALCKNYLTWLEAEAEKLISRYDYRNRGKNITCDEALLDRCADFLCGADK